MWLIQFFCGRSNTGVQRLLQVFAQTKIACGHLNTCRCCSAHTTPYNHGSVYTDRHANTPTHPSLSYNLSTWTRRQQNGWQSGVESTVCWAAQELILTAATTATAGSAVNPPERLHHHHHHHHPLLTAIPLPREDVSRSSTTLWDSAGPHTYSNPRICPC